MKSKKPSPKKSGKKTTKSNQKNPFDKFIKKTPARAIRRKNISKKRRFAPKPEEKETPEKQTIKTPDYNSDRIKQMEKKAQRKFPQAENKGMRLNRFVAHAGVCSRRDADELIFAGKVLVNGEAVKEPSYRVQASDEVKYENKILQREKFVYVLLNKPKDHITTINDPQGRKTVMNLVRQACDERIFPVGRLDRNTTGLLLLTNDGDLAEKLSHPSKKINKEYQAELNKPIDPEDAEKIKEGIKLEDGFIQADEFYYFGEGNVVGIKLHSGKNRIVRRIFEHLGYEVLRLDRIEFAGLTKKNILRGKWRYLSEKEVIRLKYMV